MIKLGTAPFLECSSKGEKRLSAVCARLKKYNNQTIEDVYQAAKVFEDGTTNLNWRDAKGKKAINMPYVANLYHELWDLYFEENPDLLELIYEYNGFTDMFGKEGCQCQAIDIYRIRNKELI